MTETAEPTPLARALGRVPTGLFIVATKGPEKPLGFVASFVVQVGFQPPTVSVAVGQDRDHLEAIRASGRFAVSILDKESAGLMGPFFMQYEDDETAFDHVAHEDSPGGMPILTGSLAWLDCAVSGEHDAGDHVVVFGTVENADLLREGDPTIHLRKDGLSY